MDKVLCPYCGAEMELDCGLAVFFTCPKCESTSPYTDTPDEALSAAMQRYELPNRAMTLNEALEYAREHPNKPLYLEPNEPDISGAGRWSSAESIEYFAAHADEFAGYGKAWRLWLRRPTDEERQSVAWEESQ